MCFCHDCAALLLTRLSDRVILKFNLKVNRRRFWTDFKVDLVWITSQLSQRQTFIIHRKEIQRKLIPLRSPYFGGLWETIVKSTKNVIFKMLSKSHLTYKEMMSTVLTRVEDCLNSHPITSLTFVQSDLSYLTSYHF